MLGLSPQPVYFFDRCYVPTDTGVSRHRRLPITKSEDCLGDMIVQISALALVAAFLQGLSSFGFPSIAAPIFTMILPAQIAVPVITLLCLVSNLPILGEITHTSVVRKEALCMVISSLVTIPLDVLC